MATIVALVSGGLDSVTLAYHLAAHGHEVHALSINYGQRHQRELDAALACMGKVAARHDIIDLQGLGALLTGSALTDPSIPVPHGHYEAETMRQTVVPNRNMILLSLAVGLATARGADGVATAVHAGDHAIYPDCRPEFILAFEQTTWLAMGKRPSEGLQLYRPFINWTKTSIARQAYALQVPIGSTYSCYEGGPVHCSRCGTCIERREGLALAGVPDPTEYADSRPWSEVLDEINAGKV